MRQGVNNYFYLYLLRSPRGVSVGVLKQLFGQTGELGWGDLKFKGITIRLIIVSHV